MKAFVIVYAVVNALAFVASAATLAKDTPWPRESRPKGLRQELFEVVLHVATMTWAAWLLSA